MNRSLKNADFAVASDLLVLKYIHGGATVIHCELLHVQSLHYNDINIMLPLLDSTSKCKLYSLPNISNYN